MSRGCTAALLLGLALAPGLAAAQAAPAASPVPPERPGVAAPAAVPGEGAFAGTEEGLPPEEPEALPPAKPPSGLLADPALAADLGALLAGQRSALAAPVDAPAPDPAAGATDAAAAGGAPSTAGGEPAAGAEPADDAATNDAVALVEPPAASDGAELMQPAPPSLVWDDGPLDAAEAARLFEVACLATLPDFAGVGAFFDALGFVTVPGMRIRNHPWKHVSALATTPADVMESGVRSCAILVDGLEQAPAASAVEALVAERFEGARRFDTPARGIAHVVWVIDTALGPAKVTVTQSGASTFIGATVLPPPAPTAAADEGAS